jgi:hypothetical protein
MRKSFEETLHQRTQITNKHMKKCSLPLIIRKIKVRIIMRKYAPLKWVPF